MGTDSTNPSNPQNSASELVKPMEGDQQDAKVETTKETSPQSVFVNSEPMREDQVQNAVKFLSHPKVRGSPVIYRRSFLEKKGLTKEEIDEAFSRVPDPPPTATSVPEATSNQDRQLKSSSNMQPHAPTHTLQPAAAASNGVISTVATLSQSRFHWSHALLAVGLIAASGAGTAVLFKNAVVPRLKSWIRKVVSEEEDDSVKKINSKPSLAEEAAASAKAAAAAAAEVAKASQEMLISKNEEKKYFEAFMNLMDVQVEELKSMKNTIQKLEGIREVTITSNNQIEQIQSAQMKGPSNTPWRSPPVDREDPRDSLTGSKQLKANGTADLDSSSVRPSSAPASIEPSVAPHPKSYMEILAMIQRGEKPPGIKDINDLPPNPNQPPSNPRLAPRVKPWEVAQAQSSSSHGLQSTVNGEGSSYKVEDYGLTSQFNGGNGSSPWWQKKNVRITELEPEDKQKTPSYVSPANDRPVPRAWVPPQPPPVAMAEAAAAIRKPKPPIQEVQADEDQLMPHPSNDVDELQRITKISESGGDVVEINSGNAWPSSNEIQEEPENGYVEK